MAYLPRFNTTPHLLKVLEEITSLNGRIEGATVGVRWVPALQKEIRERQTHGSTAIEGNPLTLAEVRVLAEGGDLPHAEPRAKQEILNYFAALRFVEQRKGSSGIDETGILKIHSIIGQRNALDRGPFGAYRSYGVRVGRHVPPPAHEVPGRMGDLLKWLNGPGQAWPAVVGSAILHYQFEFIHPFGDGNGRVGRLLATWELYRRGFDTQHIFSVDEVLLENRMAYYRSLDRAQTEGQDLTGWVEFISETVAEALRRAWRRVQSLAVSQKNPKIILTSKQERLLSVLHSGGPKSISEIQKEFKITKPGAHFILKPLIAAGLVKREGGHKTGKYGAMK
ncbi:MAG: Fic family protein [Elusimicrobia bacterium]|nr:Fic family protein [Elusimicrobiota bacterium]